MSQTSIIQLDMGLNHNLAHMEIGTPKVLLHFTLNTSNEISFVFLQKQSDIYKPQKSETFINISEKQLQEFYNATTYEGTFFQDKLKFVGEQFSIKIKMKFVSKNKLSELKSPDNGCLGLSNSKINKNFIDLAFQKGYLVSPIFGIKTNSIKIFEKTTPQQKTQFYFNISKQSLHQVQFIKCIPERIDWAIPITKLKIRNWSYSMTALKFDPSSEYILLSNEMYIKVRSLFQVYLKKKTYFGEGIQCYQSAFPTLIFQNEKTSIHVTSQMYILQVSLKKGGTQCYLAIQKTDSDTVTLGSISMRKFNVYYDKQQNSIGVINHLEQQNQGQIQQDSNVLYLSGKDKVIFVILAVVLLVSLLGILFKAKNNQNRMLRSQFSVTTQMQQIQENSRKQNYNYETQSEQISQKT